MEEAKLLRRLRRGDQRALEQAIRQYSGYVMTVIRNRSRGLLSPEDQEEVASDVFVVLWQRAAEIHAPTLRSYLGAVARNRTVDAMKKRQLSVPLEDNDIEIPDSAWACITKRALREDLAQAMGALSPRDREIFYRRYDLAESSSQIAAAMDLNPATVRSRLSRGRAILRKELMKGGYCNEDAD